MRLRRPAVALLAATAIACDPADAPPGEEASPADPEPAVIALGGEAATELATTLVTRLRQEIDQEGAAGALEFCSVEGLPLTSAVAGRIGFDIGRTSSRVRNPANAPDSLERRALESFEERADAGEPLPGALVQAASEGNYRYYRPLVVQPFCLPCHGSESDLGPGVPEALAERYPEDTATGYAAGDFRGVIRVTVPVEAIREWTPPEPP